MMMKKIILFDFFGVISSEVAPKWFRRYFNESDAKRIKDEVMVPGDLGEKNEDEILDEAARICNVEKRYVKDEWYELAKVDTDVVEYIKSLHKSHPVYLLSNAVASFLKTIIYKNDIEKIFDKIYISSELKLAKPDPEFFVRCLSDIGASPSDCVMIDDNPNNVAAAESVGITGILYRGLDDLKRKLEE